MSESSRLAQPTASVKPGPRGAAATTARHRRRSLAVPADWRDAASSVTGLALPLPAGPADCYCWGMSYVKLTAEEWARARRHFLRTEAEEPARTAARVGPEPRTSLARRRAPLVRPGPLVDDSMAAVERELRHAEGRPAEGLRPPAPRPDAPRPAHRAEHQLTTAFQ